MSIRSDVVQLRPVELVEMYVLDADPDKNNKLGVPKGHPKLFHWHNGNSPFFNNPIVWQGQTYEPYPVETDGWQVNTTGKLARPTLRVSNIGGQVGAFLRSIKDGVGAKIIRKRTLGKFLDAINFPTGNPYANPNAQMPDEVYYIARKAVENPMIVELELAVAFDVEGIMLPRRQVLASICPWVYRSPDCSYAGPPVETIDGVETDDRELDACAKTLKACKARFGKGVLRFGGFSGSLLGSNR